MASGFDNDVMYADNVDFTGGSPVSAKVTTDGQLLIGATASPNIRVNTLTAGTGIAITNGAGTISIATNGSEVANTITGDNGGALAPIASNWNILGQDSGAHQVMETSGTGSTLSIEDRTWLTPLVVDASTTVGTRGTYSTIATALTAAVSGQTIFIRPGTYTEDITLKAGVNLVGFTGDGLTPEVTIVGKATFAAAGTTTVSNIRLQTNSDFFLVISGNAASIVNLQSCYLNCSNNTGISFTSGSVSAGLHIYDCKGDIGTTGIALFALAGISSDMLIFNSDFTNSGGSTTDSTISGGNLFITRSSLKGAITTSGNAGLTLKFVEIDTASLNDICLTIGGSTGLDVIDSYLTSGGAAAITTSVVAATVKGSVLNTGTTAIAGAGTVRFSDLVLVNQNSAITTTTQTVYIRSNDAVQVKAPGAYPYTTLAQDAVILVDTSSARSIVPYASPVLGQMHRIKDSVGSAAANNITITPSGKNIDGAASYVIASNYGSVDIVYNGTEWSVL